MKPEDLPTPQALEQLLKEFMKKTGSEPSQKDADEEEEVNDLAQELPMDTGAVRPISYDEDDDFEDPYDDFDGFAELDDAFDLAYEDSDDDYDSDKDDPDDDGTLDEDSDDGLEKEDGEDNEDSDTDDDEDDSEEEENPDDEDDDDDKEFQRLYESFLREELLDNDTEDSSSTEETEPDTDPLEELMALTGLEEVKRAVQQQLYFSRIMKMRKDAGKKVPLRLMHLLLTGNPGTGKTTVAKLIGRIYKKEGILNKGHLVEANRANLVGEYIGQTEKKTLEIVEEAKGGVLFIDEIYALAEHQSEHCETKDFGFKVLDTLMPILDKVDSDLVVIGAGYPNKVRNFLQTNPGLTSRFPTVLDFKDFSVEELKEIALNILHKYDFTPTEEFLTALDSLLKQAVKIKDHGNARMANTLINNYVIPNLCTRLSLSEQPISDVEQTSLVLAKDLPTIEQLFPLAVKKRQVGFS